MSKKILITAITAVIIISSILIAVYINNNKIILCKKINEDLVATDVRYENNFDLIDIFVERRNGNFLDELEYINNNIISYKNDSYFVNYRVENDYCRIHGLFNCGSFIFTNYYPIIEYKNFREYIKPSSDIQPYKELNFLYLEHSHGVLLEYYGNAYDKIKIISVYLTDYENVYDSSFEYLYKFPNLEILYFYDFRNNYRHKDVNKEYEYFIEETEKHIPKNCEIIIKD